VTGGGSESEGQGGDITGVVKGMEGVDVMDARRKHREKGRRDIKKGSKAWIVNKKEQMERKGKVVKNTSKYTGRKRGPTF
jgi:18S rRNA (guanine1575-N7)-methyltransferase